MNDEQLIAYAVELQKLLQQCQKYEEQLYATESYIQSLSTRIFASHLQEQEGLHNSQLLRKSVACGIKRIYQHLKDNTIQEIQNLSNKIICILQPGIQASSVEDPFEVLTRLTDVDNFVCKATRTFSVFSRNS